MYRKLLSLLLAVLLLCVALPALAVPNPVVPCESAKEVWEKTQLLLPVVPSATDLSYSVIADSTAQVTFTYSDVEFLLRQQKTSAFLDISGVNETFDNADLNEDYPGYDCIYGYNDTSYVAWWFDTARKVSGSLYCTLDGSSAFDSVLYEVFTGLDRGVCYAGTAVDESDGFSLNYPLAQAEDAALTERMNQSVLAGVKAVKAAYAPDARIEQQYMFSSFVGKVFSADWGGTVAAPDAPYSDYILFSVHVDCDTGDLAPLRSLLDADQLAELTYPHLDQFLTSQYWEDPSVDDAQQEYLKALTLDDWKALLQGADFPTEAGWPPAFAVWNDGGYYRDGNEEEFPCLVVHIGVPHALQNQITLDIPFAQIDMELMEQLRIK